jgi:ring-1,2-phenylacetyl-CoA epoxidase subunit PaaE
MLRFHPLRVSAIRPEAEDAVCVTLDVPPELRDEFRSQAGQHVVVRAQVDGAEQRRTYSLLNAAGEIPLRIAVRTHSRGQVSRHIAKNVRPGDTLEVMPPNGSFGPRERGVGTYVAFAAGCGITPIVSMVKTLLASDPQRRVLLFYGNRNYARGMLLEELLALKDRYLDRFALHFIMSGEPQEIELLNGRLDASKVTELAKGLFDPAQVRDFFVCGPGTMIDDIGGALRALGVDAARIHSEHFTSLAAGVTNPTNAVGTTAAAQAAATPAANSSDAAAADNAGGAVKASVNAPRTPTDANITQVEVVMDGRRRIFTMRMKEDTILDAAERAGIDLPFSCKAGVCSTCRTKLVRGKVELDQNYALEDWELEQGFILACQAHAQTPELELNYDET